MASPLLGSLATTINKAFKALFLDATLTRDVAVAGTDPADPPPPTQVTYTCKAIEQEWSAGLLGMGLINSNDLQVLILAKSLEVDPLPLDRITIRDKTLTVVPANAGGIKAVQTDPARATWLLRCRK